MANVNVILGKTLKSVKKIGEECIVFETSDGEVYRMEHHQDCCECVTIDDVEGDLQSLVDNPILVAEESSNCDSPEGLTLPKYSDESYTWTFYKFATIKGHVDIRWFGSSNGYYSERVDFDRVE